MTASETATRLLEAFNDGDWDAFRAGVTDDVVYVESGTGRRSRAPTPTSPRHGWRTALPDVSGTVHRALEGGGVVRAGGRPGPGRHDGPLPTPDGDIPATGAGV